MDNIINQMIDFESEIHIQVDVEEKNAEGKTGKYLEKENGKIFERRSGKKAVFCPRLESTKKKEKKKDYIVISNFTISTSKPLSYDLDFIFGSEPNVHVLPC